MAHKVSGVLFFEHFHTYLSDSKYWHRSNSAFIFQVLSLFWNLAHSDEVVTEIVEQALCAHVKILDYSCSQVRLFAQQMRLL